MNKKLYIRTYGCQMNVYDSERIEELLNYSLTEKLEEADVVVLNTCHIREKAAEKIYSELGKINLIKTAKKGKLIIVVAGCVAQAEGDEIFSRAPFVDIVVGPQSYHTLPQLISQIEKQEKHLIELDFIEESKFDILPQERKKRNGSSGFLSVQEGCDKFCTFCVVPYTRGAEFSRPIEKVYREALELVSNGIQEITLLGQNVNAYHGVDFMGKEHSLASLISKLAEIKDLKRIRYVTSHPIDMKDDLIDIHGSEEKLMPFLHLPIQSGSDRVLKLMNRKHNVEHYMEIITKLRKKRPDIALSSDFIVGFPGETEEDFMQTLSLVKELKYAQCFSFKYSPRPGTPAAFREQISESEKDRRLKILQEEIMRQQMIFNQETVGKKLPVLFEKSGKFENQILGKSPYLQSVYLDANQDIIGKIVEVKIVEAFQNSLRSEI